MYLSVWLKVFTQLKRELYSYKYFSIHLDGEGGEMRLGCGVIEEVDLKDQTRNEKGEKGGLKEQNHVSRSVLKNNLFL